MLLVITNADVYTPIHIGKKDIVVEGHRIQGIYPQGSVVVSGIEASIIDAKGHLLVPGFIDGHVHIAGAGGEGGPCTRTEGLKFHDMLAAGVTTVIGCLGTDGFTRSLESVLMKVKQLRSAGVSAWMYSGSYQVPPVTFLGDVGRDIALIDEIIGAGEIAVGDHRSSCPSAEDIARIAAHARVGGLLGGKAGIVNIHIGDSKESFRILNDALKIAQYPSTQFWPTHCARSADVFEDALKWGEHGFVDITASDRQEKNEISPWDAAATMLARGVSVEHITFTSDACGSLPRFDEKGELISIDYGRSDSLLFTVKMLVKINKIPFETALAMVTANPASILKLSKKGMIVPGYDADMVILHNETYAVDSVIAMGNRMIIHDDEYTCRITEE